MDNIYLIVGASGSGKTQLVTTLEEQYGMKSIQSYTTRAKRYPGEKGHIFITLDEYKNFDPKDFAAYTFYNGNHYFATSDQVDECDLYVIDIDGIKYFKEKYKGKKQPVVINIYADENARMKRMARRGDSIYDINERVLNDMTAFCEDESFDYVIDTSRLTKEEVVEEFLKIING